MQPGCKPHLLITETEILPGFFLSVYRANTALETKRLSSFPAIVSLFRKKKHTFIFHFLLCRELRAHIDASKKTAVVLMPKGDEHSSLKPQPCFGPCNFSRLVVKINTETHKATAFRNTMVSLHIHCILILITQ